MGFIYDKTLNLINIKYPTMHLGGSNTPNIMNNNIGLKEDVETALIDLFDK